MNAIEIYNAQKNGQDIVPQFTPPSGTFLYDSRDNSYKNGYIDKSSGDFKYTQNGQKYFVDEKTRINSPYYQVLKGEDLPSFADKKVQNMTMLYNALEALKTRQFNEKMYDQRYQKIITDIKKAGLNPYAINFFSPGGVQSGSAASIMSNYQASQSHVRSQSKIKSESKNENTNHNYGDYQSAGIIGVFQMLGMVVGAIVKAIAG